MTNDDIKKLRDYCADFAEFRKNTEDGSGSNLHDIKNTFDYVRKTMEKEGLTTTEFGANLAKNAESTANVLSELWNCLYNLEQSVESFCQQQEKNNRTTI